MASRTIKGLTVEINGDTTKLGDALKSSEKQLKSMRTELTDVRKLLRFDSTSVDALTQKKELLSKAISACADKLEILQNAEQQMQAQAEKGDDWDEKYRALQREIIGTTSQMNTLQKELDGTYRSLNKLGDESTDVATAINRMDEAAEASKTSSQRLAEALTDVNNKSDSLADELDEVNRLLKDAPQSTHLWAQKQEILAEACQNTARKLELLQEAQRDVQRQFEKGEASEQQVRELERAVISAASELDDYERKARLAAKGLDEMGDEAEEAARDVEKAGDGFTTFKGVISNLISEGLEILIEKLIEVGQYMGQVGLDFGASMSKVEALIGPTDATAENMQKLSDYAMEMGAKTKFSANESAEAMTYLAQAGWGTEQIMSGLSGVMALAATDNVELATAAEITAQAINALGYEASDAGKFADLLAVTAAETCTDVEEMGYAFQYVGPVAGALGFEMEDLSVAIGMMANAGISGQKAGTSLRSLFTNMAKPTAAMSTAMEEYGISLTNASGEMKPLSQIMTELRGVFDGLTEAQQTELAATLAGKTGMAGLLSIVNASPEEFNAMTQAVTESTGAADKMATVMQDNLAGDVEKLGGAFETLSLKIMQDFDEPLRQATQAMTAFLDGEMSFKDMLVQLTESIAQMGQKFQEYLPTLMQIGQDLLVYIINGITVGLPILMEKATELVASFGTTIAQNAPTLVTIAGSLLTSFVQGIFNFIPQLITSAAEIVGSLAKGIQGNTASFVSKALDLLDGFADKLTEALPKLIQSGMEFLLNMAKGISQALPEFISRAPEIISKFANLINDNFPTILAKGVGIIWELIKGIVKAIPTLVANIPKIITAIVDVWEAFNWLSLGKKCIDLLGKGIKGMVGFIKNAGTSIKDGVVNIIKKLPENLKSLGQSAANGLGNAIKAGVSLVKAAAKNVLEGILLVFRDMPTKVISIGKDLVRGLWNGISDMAGWVIGKIQGFGESVLDGIKDFFGIKSPSREFAKIGMYLDQGLAKGITDNADGVIKSAQDMAAGVLDGASMDGLALERDLQNRTVKRALSVTTMADSSMLGKLDKILTAIEKGQIITLDSKQLVGGTVKAYDNALGQRRMLAARGAI